MKNFTTLTFIISLLGLTTADLTDLQGKKELNPSSVEFDKFVGFFGKAKNGFGDKKHNAGHKKHGHKGGKHGFGGKKHNKGKRPAFKGKKQAVKKQDAEGFNEIAEEENENNADDETIVAAGGYDSDDDYHHGRHHGLYRRAEEAELNSRHRRHGHRRHGRGYGGDDSDCSDSDSGYSHRRHHGRHRGLYRRAEEAELNNRYGRHGYHGKKHNVRGYGWDDSDCSDSDRGYGRRKNHGRRHGLYRRAEEEAVGRGGRGYGRRRNYRHRNNHFDSDCTSYSDDSGSDSNDACSDDEVEKPIEAAPATTPAAEAPVF